MKCLHVLRAMESRASLLGVCTQTHVHTQSLHRALAMLRVLPPGSECAECCRQVWSKLADGLGHISCSYEDSSGELSVRLHPCWQHMPMAAAARAAGGSDPNAPQGRSSLGAVGPVPHACPVVGLCLIPLCQLLRGPGSPAA